MRGTGSIPRLVGLPLLGSLPEFQRDRLGFLLRVRRDYGDIAHFRLAWRDVYLLSSPEAIKHVLVDNNKGYFKGEPYGRLEPILGKGLLTSSGDFWLQQRRLMQPAFHHRYLATLASMMVKATEEMLEDWEAIEREGQPVDIHAEMMRLALTILGRALFSTDLRGQAGEARVAMDVLLEQLHRRISTPVEIPAIFPTVEDRVYRREIRNLNHMVEEIIEVRRNSREDQDDLLARLIQATEGDLGMADQQLRDEVITLILAGHETTANALSWTWYLLSKHPSVMQSLSAELSTQLNGRKPDLPDLPNLPYNRMVIEESLRLYPPSWLITRTALEKDIVSGVVIPANSIIFLSQYVTHRHPDYWENPEIFDPERFALEGLRKRPDFAYFPFGGGPRKCIGEQFAMLEAQIVLAMMAQRYRLELVPDYPVIPQPTITLRPKQGIWMHLKARPDKE